jgi:hypothetical protein
MPQHHSMSGITNSGESQAHRVESCLIEINANKLMNDLFQDLDQDLDQVQQAGHGLSAQIVPVASSQTVVSESATDSDRSAQTKCDLLVPYTPYSGRPFELDQCDPEDIGIATRDLSLQLATPLVTSETAPVGHSAREQVLFAVACTTLLMTAALGAMGLLWRAKVAKVNTIAAAPPPVKVSPAEQEFARYLQNSLDLIERQPTMPKPAAAPESNADLASSAVDSSAQSLERVYVPVYQPPPPKNLAQPAKAPVATLPAPLSKKLSVIRSAPLPPPPVIAQYAPQGQLPALSKPNSGEKVAIKPLPAPGKNTSTYTLLGFLEDGDRSVALVQGNGTTQRVAVGQILDASGWQLVQISEGKAVVQKGGEVRSILAGQQF